MKKIIISSLLSIACVVSAQAQFFTNGNLAVVRMSGYDTTSSTGAAVFIDQYTTSGQLAGSFAVPTSGGNALILNGQGYEGLLNLTPDGTHLVLAGFNTALPYTTNINSSASALVPRVVATLDAYANFTLAITNMTNFNASAVSSAASDGTNFWLCGTGPSPSASVPLGYNEIAYVGTATAGATNQVPPNNLFTTSMREVTLCNVAGTYELYGIGNASNSAFGAFRNGAFLLSNISGTLPQTTTGATNLFPGHFAYDLAINPSGTIAYMADNDDGIIKFTNSGSGWVSNYTVSLVNAQAGQYGNSATSVTADWSQAPPVVYATSGETITNRLVVFQDTNAAGVDTVITLAKGSIVSGAGGVTNTYRGVRFVPQAYAYISVPPVAFTGDPGETATFSATVLGVPAPTCQWYSNSVANPTYVAIPGATSTNLSVANINVSQSGSLFYLVVSNVYGMSQSAPVALSVYDPAIVTEPAGVTNVPGSPVSLCVTAVGTGTLTYQWLSNGVAISGAQSSCYSVPSSVTLSNTVSYTVIVSNSLNESITSSPAIVSFTPYLLYDTFTYPNGDLASVAGSPWMNKSDTSPIVVFDDRVELAQSNVTAGTAFYQSLYSQPQAELSTILWASFTINVTALPRSPHYFAYFEDTNFDFYGRIFVLTSNNPALTPDMPPVAYPGTYRLGIANDAGDPTSGKGPSAVVELDMAPGIDYQVVEYYDMVNGFSQLAVNPSQTEASQVYYPNGPNALTSGYANDLFSPVSLPMAAYGLREPAGIGNIQLGNLEVSYDWNGQFSGFAAVTAGVTPALANIGFLTPGFTNYAGNSNVLEVAASGIDLTYAWYQNNVQLTDGTNVSGSATPTLSLSYLEGTNSGSYTVVISDDAGSVTSSPAFVDVITTPTPPSFTAPGASEPATNTTVAEGGSVTLTATAVGTGPITYQWFTNSLSYPQSGVLTSPNFTLTDVTTNQAGTYFVVATGGTGLTATSSNAVLTVLGPIYTNIHYLRSLLTSQYYTSDTAQLISPTLYTIQGVVTVATNLTSQSTASYYVQDSTGGINLFETGDATFRPALGDVVTATGVLSSYYENLELDVTAGAQFQTYAILTNADGSPVTNALPAPILLPWGYTTANPGPSATNIAGSIVTMTNVYFATPGAVFNNSTANYAISNASGEIFNVFVSEEETNFDGQPIPAFAYSVTGVLYTYPPYAIIVSRYSDIVAAPPPPVVDLTGALSGIGNTNVTLTWTAVPNNYTYSVWSTTNLATPFVPLATGLWFGTPKATYTDVGPSSTAKFYMIVSP
jgi:hypothetical protein